MPIELTLAPRLQGETRRRSDRFVETHIESIAAWYRKHIWAVEGFIVMVPRNRRQLRVTIPSASGTEFYDEMITDPDEDGNHPLILSGTPLGVSARLVNLYVKI
jgi:hypothetical protein